MSQLSVEEARRLLDEGQTLFVDVRDRGSFEEAHVPGATHLGNHNLEDFLRTTAKDRRIVAYCYHGNASQAAAAFLAEHGFADVHSMAGGFETWRDLFGADPE